MVVDSTKEKESLIKDGKLDSKRAAKLYVGVPLIVKLVSKDV